MKTMKRIAAVLLALALALGCGCGLAENTKHERVYVVTGADGTVRSLTDSIRLENADGAEEITDRTMLTGIENVGGKETFTLDGETLTWQAGGRDIVYQGTSGKTPAVLPQAELTLDGEAVTAAELKEKTGEAVLNVTFRSEVSIPALAVTVLKLPETGVEDLKTENAVVLNEMGQRILVGWAVTGLEQEVNLPSSFRVTFRADHADLKWMMTLATADPVSLLGEEAEKLPGDWSLKDIDSIRTILQAVKDGESVPLTVTGKTQMAAFMINTLNTSLEQLDQGALDVAGGAKDLSDGAAALKEGADGARDGAATLASGMKEAGQGAAALDSGLAEIAKNNEMLNAGAQQLFGAALKAANTQLNASGLSAAGIDIPELTAENYAQVLDGLAETIGLLDSQAAEELKGLKAQLDQVNEFTVGLKAYTDGVAGAAEGASRLNTGMATLKEGADALAAGTATLADGAGQLADGAAALKTGAVKLQTTGTGTLKNTVSTLEKNAAETLLGYVAKAESLMALAERGEDRTGYDLRPEGMKTLTAYIIRTDLQ